MPNKEPRSSFTEAHAQHKEVPLQPEVELQEKIAQLHTYILVLLFESKRPITQKELVLMDKLRDARGDLRETNRINASDIPTIIARIQSLTTTLSLATDSSQLSEYYNSLNKSVTSLSNSMQLLPPSRRSFLKIASLLGIGTALGVTPFAVQTVDHSFRRYNGLEEPDPSNPEDDSYEETLRFIKERYNLDIYNGIAHPLSGESQYSGEKVIPENLGIALSILRAELGKYPPSIFSQFKLKTLRLVTNLHYNGIVSHGLFMPFSDEVLLDFSSNDTSDQIKKASHHEFFHFFDFYENGYESDENAHWEELNNCDCVVYERYVDGSRNQPNQTSEAPMEQFATSYGRTNELEDRATIAQVLMNAQTHREFEGETARLRSLGTVEGVRFAEIREAKKNQVMLDYFRFSNGRMDAFFWEDLLNERVAEGYFS